VLADTGNVTAAVAATKLSRAWVYAVRRKDPIFNMRWEEALEMSMDELESKLRDRAMHGTQKPVFHGGKEVGMVNSYSDTLGMFFLKHRRKNIFGDKSADKSSTRSIGVDLDEAGRVKAAPDLTRIVIALDPPVSHGEKADTCGIIVAGVDDEGASYVLADRTIQGLRSNAWARTALDIMDEFKADRIIAEVNNGGDLVEDLMRQIAPRQLSGGPGLTGQDSTG
jgi:hypothetical protein